MKKAFIKKIMVAVSGRINALHAAMYAIMMSKTYGTSLKFVYVVDTETIKMLSMNKLLISEEKDGFEAKLRENGENFLNYVQILAAKKGVQAETELRSGGIFTEIIKAADEYQADLILLGGTERESLLGKSKRNVMNREENEILANSKCPVLIVQNPDIENQFKNF